MRFLRCSFPILVVITLASLARVTPVGAAVVFDGGPADVANGQALYWDMADDFEIPNSATVNGATVPILAILGGRNLATWDGTLQWKVFAAGPPLLNPNGTTLSTTTPGAVIAQGAGLGIQTTFLSESPGPFGDPYQYYSFNFSFGQDIALAANTRYWFGLHLNQSYTQAYLYWQQTNTHLYDHNFGRPNQQSAYGYQGSWVSFALNYNVPEPASLALLGLPTLLLIRRARRVVTASSVFAVVVMMTLHGRAGATVITQTGFESSEGYASGAVLNTVSPWSGQSAGWTISTASIGGSGARAGNQWVLVDTTSSGLPGVVSPVTNFAAEPILTLSCSMKVVSPTSGTPTRNVFMGFNTGGANDGYAEVDYVYDVQNQYGFGAGHWLIQQIGIDFVPHLTDLGTASRYDSYVDVAMRINMQTGVTTTFLNGAALPITVPAGMSDYYNVQLFCDLPFTGARPRGGFDNLLVTQAAVPEPPACGLAALAVLRAARRRRRVAAARTRSPGLARPRARTLSISFHVRSRRPSGCVRRPYTRHLAITVLAVAILSLAQAARAATILQAGFESAEGFSAGTQLGTYPAWAGNGGPTSGWAISSATVAGSGARSGSQWVLVNPLAASAYAVNQRTITPISDFSAEALVTASCSVKFASPASGTVNRGGYVAISAMDSIHNASAEIDIYYDLENTLGYGAGHWVIGTFFGNGSSFFYDQGTTSRFDNYFDLSMRMNYATGLTTMYVNGAALPDVSQSMMIDFYEFNLWFANTTQTSLGVRPRAGFDNFSIVQSAVPEPSLVGLMGLTAAGVTALGRRARRTMATLPTLGAAPVVATSAGRDTVTAAVGGTRHAVAISDGVVYAWR